MGEYRPDQLPAIAGTVYFHVVAEDKSGRFVSPEYQVRVHDAPVAEFKNAPASIQPGEKIPVQWELRNGAKVVRTCVRWGTRSGQYYNLSSAQSGKPGLYGATIQTPPMPLLGSPPDKYYLQVDAEVDGRKITSAERVVSVVSPAVQGRGRAQENQRNEVQDAWRLTAKARSNVHWAQAASIRSGRGDLEGTGAIRERFSARRRPTINTSCMSGGWQA